MTRRIMRILLATAIWAGAATAVLAHSFNLGVIAPDDAALRADLRAAFLIASEERDGHANEESEGHLGGLDVYLSFLTPGATSAAPVPDVLAATLEGTDTDTAEALSAALGAAYLGPPNASATAEGQTFLQQPSSPGLAPFAARYAEATGRQPDTGAQAMYITARRVALAVRLLGGVDDRAALAAIMAQ